MNIEVCLEGSPRWEEFVTCLNDVAPEQAPFVLGDYARHLPCRLLIAIEGDRVVGFLRMGIQPIGAEEGQPHLGLAEAKIHAFGVRPESRRQGVGTALQVAAMELAASLNCHQLASHSSYDRYENLGLKLALGFCAAPDSNGSGIRLFMPLKRPNADGLRGWQRTLAKSEKDGQGICS